MNAFFNALHALFATEPHNAFYSAIGGRFSYGEALPQGAKPYAVFFGVTSLPTDTFSEELDDFSFQVNVYGSGTYQEVAVILSHCRALFDGAVLTVNGYDIMITREMQTPPWRDGDLWAAAIEFSTIIQET
ncbi:hypothetical protein [Desulfuromonas thiophila]|uniref:hypothetical protein n=1 Tax=Desulfuromonas thiophila TaxID=57664 RepID=UPI0029F56085|nr:hypothetical protein [Desulfuromonas thiophila]